MRDLRCDNIGTVLITNWCFISRYTISIAIKHFNTMKIPFVRQIWLNHDKWSYLTLAKWLDNSKNSLHTNEILWDLRCIGVLYCDNPSSYIDTCISFQVLNGVFICHQRATDYTSRSSQGVGTLYQSYVYNQSGNAHWLLEEHLGARFNSRSATRSRDISPAILYKMSSDKQHAINVINSHW